MTNVLIVDDEASIRLTLASFLERAGCRVSVAANAEEAEALARRTPSDVLVADTAMAYLGRALEEDDPYKIAILDMQMPNTDGYSATGRIREWERSLTDGRIPIIALTANALKGDREKCLGAGMDDYLSKPIDPGRLAAMVAKWTDGGHV